MQTDTITPEVDSSSALAAAEAQFAVLVDAADRAQQLATAAKTAFEAEPTAQAHTEHVVAVQRAKTAFNAADSYRTNTLAPLEARVEHERLEARRAALREELASERIKALETTIEDAVRHVVQVLDSAGSELGALLIKHRNMRERAESIGVRVDMRSSETIYGRLNARFDALRPTSEHSVYLTGGHDFVSLKISRPAKGAA